MSLIPVLVPAIQPPTGAGASGAMDPGAKHRDDMYVSAGLWTG
jgi:hypothetical protein